MNPPRIPGRPGLSRGSPQPPPGRPRGPGQPGRPFRPTPAQSNPLPIIFGAVGVILVVVLLIVMSSGGAEKAPVKEAPPPAAPPPRPKPVDVSGLERDGLKACNEALAKLRSIESKMAKDVATMSDTEKEALKAELKTILELFRDGMAYLNEANEKSGRGYDFKDYVPARRLASDKFKQLGGKLDNP